MARCIDRMKMSITNELACPMRVDSKKKLIHVNEPMNFLDFYSTFANMFSRPENMHWSWAVNASLCDFKIVNGWNISSDGSHARLTDVVWSDEFLGGNYSEVRTDQGDFWKKIKEKVDNA